MMRNTLQRALPIMLALALVASFGLVTALPVGAQDSSPATWYVAETGDDSNDGTEETPWLSIQHAVDQASAGDTIVVAAGTYEEQVTVNKNLIVVGIDHPTIQAPDTRTSREISGQTGRVYDWVVLVEGADDFTFDGFIVDGREAGGSIRYVGVLVGNSEGTIKNNEVLNIRGDDSGTGGIIVVGVDSNVRLESNVVSNFSKNGITVNLDAHAIVEGNTITGGALDEALAQNGIQVGFGATGEVKGNLVSLIQYDGDWGAAGVLVYNASDVIIDDNTLEDCEDGILIQLAANVTATGNVIRNNRSGYRIYFDGEAWTAIDMTLSGNEFFDNERQVRIGPQYDDSIFADGKSLVDVLIDNSFSPDSVLVEDGSARAIMPHTVVPVINATQARGYDLIQDAIDGATAGDTIEVKAGTHDETITIPEELEGLQLLGAQSGVDARNRDSVGESVVQAPGAYGDGYKIRIYADDVIIDGFTLKDFWLVGSAGSGVRDGVTFANNIFDGSRLFPSGPLDHYASNNLTVKQNWFRDTPSNAFYHEEPATNLKIIDNLFTDIGYSAIILAAQGGQANYEDTTISGNMIQRTHAQALNIQGDSQTRLTIENNTIEAAGQGFESDSGRGAIRLYSGLPYEGVRIEGNELRNSLTGITVRSGTVDWTDVSIAFNNMVGNDWGILNQSDTEIDATNNWWGDATGPYHDNTNLDGQGNRVSNNVLFQPWLGELYEPEKKAQADTGEIACSTCTGAVEALGTESVEDLSPEALDAMPEDFVFPHGLFSFDIVGLPIPGDGEEGTAVQVSITLPSEADANMEYWKYYEPEGWVEIPMEISDDNPNVIIITLVDGGLGDADGTADGTIVDPGGPIILQQVQPPPVSHSPAVGGEAYAANKLALLAPWLGVLSLILMGGVLVLRRRSLIG